MVSSASLFGVFSFLPFSPAFTRRFFYPFFAFYSSSLLSYSPAFFSFAHIVLSWLDCFSSCFLFLLLFLLTRRHLLFFLCNFYFLLQFSIFLFSFIFSSPLYFTLYLHFAYIYCPLIKIYSIALFRFSCVASIFYFFFLPVRPLVWFASSTHFMRT